MGGGPEHRPIARAKVVPTPRSSLASWGFSLSQGLGMGMEGVQKPGVLSPSLHSGRRVRASGWRPSEKVALSSRLKRETIKVLST